MGYYSFSKKEKRKPRNEMALILSQSEVAPTSTPMEAMDDV
jgi:hypothetical protein